ncbi:conserved Plasmodium protein, unknown function [Plasmodium gallinaceum]|uniref:Uncharacterized protein n=1 Tax=Plasmodium gallinaceum TaxID=5849 RepID=A0A1J1GW37_PLAGA|nr:conserved Plasmodium protein, unknown function [Plasmodium gallinaceum]CRG96651.1 conserved Plasmodium protein, unknown function [Plasmodium gallinaceum]
MFFFSFFLYKVIFYLNLFYFCFNENFEKIKYPQDLTKIKYYESYNKIDKKYLYKHVGKPILQDIIISVKIEENEKEDKILYLPKKKNFLKIKGDWSEYPKDKIKMICIAFIQKNQLLSNEELKCPKDIFDSPTALSECYIENNFSIINLFLYIEISQINIEKLFSLYNIPVVINSDNYSKYFTNDKKKSKEQKPNLDLHLCYKSYNESPLYLGKVIFNAYPLNIQKNMDDYDVIYTKSFLTSNWDYNLFINGDYITIYNRVVFISFPREDNKNKKCAPFWDYGILGSGALNKIKKKDKNISSYEYVEYNFSNNIPNKYYIPFIKNDDLQTNENYLICLYSDENDFEGMELKNIHFYMNTTDSVILIFLIIFVIVFLPLIFSLTYLCVLVKMNILKIKMKKLQLLNRKDEIEEKLKKELNLDQYESI